MKQNNLSEKETLKCDGCGCDGGEKREIYRFAEEEERCGNAKNLCAGCVVEYVAERVELVEVEAFINRLMAEKARREQKVNSSYPGRT